MLAVAGFICNLKIKPQAKMRPGRRKPINALNHLGDKVSACALRRQFGFGGHVERA
jgi:hypothetical protein